MTTRTAVLSEFSLGEFSLGEFSLGEFSFGPLSVWLDCDKKPVVMLDGRSLDLVYGPDYLEVLDRERHTITGTVTVEPNDAGGIVLIYRETEANENGFVRQVTFIVSSTGQSRNGEALQGFSVIGPELVDNSVDFQGLAAGLACVLGMFIAMSALASVMNGY